MGDDIGVWNIDAYNRWMMAGETPNIDKVVREGPIFTDYYSEASCMAGHANIITGMLGIANITIVVVTTDNGTETFSSPDGGNTPFRGTKGKPHGKIDPILRIP